MRKVIVFGQGYVGLPIAMKAVEAGYNVVGFDTNAERVRRLQDGESFVDDIGNDELRSALDSGRYAATTVIEECEGFEVAVITVPTPLKEGVPDLSYIEDASIAISHLLTRGSLVVLESTTYPGTTEEFVAPILERNSGLVAGSDFYLGYSPERIDPGNPTFNLGNTPKVVSGVNQQSLEAVASFYSDLVETTVPVSSTRAAELTKLLENTFRHVNIALVNELSMFAGQMGIDIWEVVEAANSKPFGFMRFTPGPGVGGHCLPIDPSYLSWKVKQTVGDSFRFVELANDINDHMPNYVVNRVNRLLNKIRVAVNGSRILILGLSYKKNTGDMRESPSIAICEGLLNLGADVRVVDHWVHDVGNTRWARVELTPEELQLADLVILVTDHDDFDYEMILDKARLIFDTRGRLAASGKVERL